MNAQTMTQWLALALSILAANLPAQAHLTFLAPVVTGTNATGPHTTSPLPGMRVLCYFTNLANNQPVVQSLVTDTQGRIAIPFNHTPISSILNLKGPLVEVYRPRYVDPLTTVYISPSIHVDYSIHPTTIDVTAIATPLVAISAAECNAYFHTWWALERLDTMFGATFTQPLKVRFNPGNDPSIATYTHPPSDIVDIYINGYDPTGSLVARSATILAHECGHRAIGNTMPIFLQEGIADYLAAATTNTSIVGQGINSATLPRNIDTPAQYTTVRGPSPQTDGLVVAGALYHAQAQGAGPALRSNLLNAAFVGPNNESLLLLRLLQLDDDDANLQNGTPSAAAFWRSFTAGHGVPWPVNNYVAPAGLGFGSPTSTPTLTGTHGANLDVRLSGAPAQQLGFLMLSGPSPYVQSPVAGSTVHVDLGALYGSAFFLTDSIGGAVFTMHVPAYVGAFTMQAAVVGGTGYLGLAGSNGLHVRR